MGTEEKPLASECPHVWMNVETVHAIAQVCKACKLFRYKTASGADWEYRAPIPFLRAPAD